MSRRKLTVSALSSLLGVLSAAGLARATPSWERGPDAPASVSGREHAGFAYDASRGVCVLFGAGYGTMEYDGAGWSASESPGGPAYRSSTEMVYDPVRACIVLFGGVPMSADTWEIFQGRWRPGPSAPAGLTARAHHAMAFDASRGATVLFGGQDASGVRNDTWLYDGTWTAGPPPAPGLVPRSLHAMAHDAASGRTVLFGGADGNAVLGDVWLLDGTGWSPGPVGPPARAGHAMVFDDAIGRIRLVGGGPGMGDSWELAGGAWIAGPGAPGRDGLGLAFDQARGRVVLVGSVEPGSDTWELHGTTWLRGPDAGTSLAPRYGHAMAYDSTRRVVVAFGGENDGSPFAQYARNDTWEYDGRHWRRGPDPPPGLQPRTWAAMAFDPARGTSVLFGGANLNGSLGDTWEYDGATWQPGPAGPPARDFHAMAFDAARARTVMFGGWQMTDTWEFDGTWHPGPGAPPALRPRTGSAMAFDALASRIVLFGGYDGVELGDTWLYDGTQWTPGPSPGPPPRSGHAMAYDLDRGVTVMFGGAGTADTWELGASGWMLSSTPVAPSPRSWPAMAAIPFLGEVLMLGGGYEGAAETWSYRCLAVSPQLLGDGVSGIAYAATLTATGGSGAPLFAVSAGTLPPGLGLSSQGVLAGIPTTPGDYAFAVKSVDPAGCAGGRAYEIRISCAASIGVGPAILPAATQGGAYSTSITASGGTAPHVFSLEGGTLPAGLTLSPSGVLSGSPRSVGSHGLRIRATDATGCFGDAVVTLPVLCASPLVVTPATLPDAVAGTFYSQPLSATGGIPPYLFALAQGSLPLGISLSPYGGLVGGPRVTGTFSFTVDVRDSRGCTGSRAYTLVVVCGAPTISPSMLPVGAVGVGYLAALFSQGGVAPYTYGVTSGALPPGLALGGNTISGTPTQTGTFPFEIKTTDAAGCTGSRSYSIDVVNCPPIVIDPPALPGGYPLTPYSVTLTGSGGSGPYRFTLVAGVLPPGLQLQSYGRIGGYPTQTGTFPFTVEAKDDIGCTGRKDYTIVIDCGSGFDILPVSAPAGKPGIWYSMSLSATGGNTPYSFFMASGTLPPGLALSGSVISGTPSTPGSFVSTVGMTDAGGCPANPRTYTIDVTCGVSFQTTSLPRATVERQYVVQIYAKGGAAPYTYQLATGALPPGLSLSTGGRITGAPRTLGWYPFSVHVTDSTGCDATQPFTIEVWTPADIAAGRGAGAANANRVRLFEADGTPTPTDFDAYAAGAWGVRVSALDLDAAGPAELATGPGPGASLGPQVRGFEPDGSALAKVNFYAYGTLNYGVNVSGGDVDGDVAAEILAAPGPGAVFGPQVRGFEAGSSVTPIAKINFYAYGTLRYGAHVGAGKLDGDAFTEIVTGAGPGPSFAPVVRGFDYDGASVSAISKVNFQAMAQTEFGAVVAGGDLDGDGYGEMVAAPGPGPALLSRAVGFDYDGTAVATMPGADIVPFPTLYGSRVGTGTVTDDLSVELAAGAGPDPAAAPLVKSYDYVGAALTQIPNAIVPFPGGFGVDVAAGPLGL